jgi:uroporphyrinogen-III synthase
LDAVLFHSARAAQILASLNPPDPHRLRAVCISAAVADAARKTAWKQVIVASAPREDALVAALGLG